MLEQYAHHKNTTADKVLKKYTGNEECVVVPGNIDAVSSDAFTKIDYETSEEYDFANIKKIVFSEGIKKNLLPL